MYQHELFLLNEQVNHQWQFWRAGETFIGLQKHERSQCMCCSFFVSHLFFWKTDPVRVQRRWEHQASISLWWLLPSEHPWQQFLSTGVITAHAMLPTQASEIRTWKVWVEEGAVVRSSCVMLFATSVQHRWGTSMLLMGHDFETAWTSPGSLPPCFFLFLAIPSCMIHIEQLLFNNWFVQVRKIMSI